MGMFSQSTGFAGAEDFMQEGDVDASTETVEAVERQIVQERNAIRAEAEMMSEVRVRMHKAKCYEALLQNPLFGPNPHPLAAEVEAEVREFVMERLCLFMGMKPETKQSSVADVFDEDQIGALTMMANRILKRPLTGGAVKRNEPAEPRVHAAVVRDDGSDVSVVQAVIKPAQAPFARKPTPVQAPAQPQADRAVKMVPHPLTGKMVPVSTLSQTKPEGIKPVEQPVSGDFASGQNQANGGFVDMTGGAAPAAAQIGVSHGSIGGGIGNPAVHGQLINYFLGKK